MPLYGVPDKTLPYELPCILISVCDVEKFSKTVRTNSVENQKNLLTFQNVGSFPSVL